MLGRMGATKDKGSNLSTTPTVDLLTVGRRLRHLRRQRGLTLSSLGEQVGCTASHLSTIENGRREPKLGLLQALADALAVALSDLLTAEPPSRRAALEIELERFQRHPSYAALGMPLVRSGPRLPTDALESLVALHAQLRRQANERLATPEEARRANVELRRRMRARDNYYVEIEQAARPLLAAVGHRSGPLSHQMIARLAAHLGFVLQYVDDLPRSTRSVTDLRHRRIYLPQTDVIGSHDPRTVVLQTLGHFVLGHADPTSYADFLRQRVEANYLAAALLIPEDSAVQFLQGAKRERNIAIEDLRDTFAVSYETAAHRFCNLATRHLGLPVHFMRLHESGTIYKAYENDGVRFPTDVTGAIEGQSGCRAWAARTVFASSDKFTMFTQYTDTTSGTYWCAAHVEGTASGEHAISVGTSYEHAKWFRGRDTTRRMISTCPDPSCCRQPPPSLSARWDGQAWPCARAHSHLLAALPPGTFPGVDAPDLYSFLERHAASADADAG
jgi:XRE family transcriptional regulator, fatty acid utilization regulator